MNKKQNFQLESGTGSKISVDKFDQSILIYKYYFFKYSLLFFINKIMVNIQ